MGETCRSHTKERKDPHNLTGIKNNTRNVWRWGSVCGSVVSGGLWAEHVGRTRKRRKTPTISRVLKIIPAMCGGGGVCVVVVGGLGRAKVVFTEQKPLITLNSRFHLSVFTFHLSLFSLLSQVTQ